MKIGLIRLRMYLTVAVMLIAAGLLLIQPQTNSVAAVAPQGKGGTIKPVATPTPAKKVTPKKGAPASRVNPKPSQNTSPKEDDAQAMERTYWESIRNSTDPEDFRAYLKKYPNGQFADLAKNRIRALEALKPQGSPTATPAPGPTPGPAAPEWPKPERDLPASARLEWEQRELSFSVPSGWRRKQEEQGSYQSYPTYRQIHFRAPESPLTNISIQVYKNYFPHKGRDGRIDSYSSQQEFIERRRKAYGSQNVSARLTDIEVLNHPNGRWLTFTADVHDMRSMAPLAASLDALYPDDLWQDKSANFYVLNPGALDAFNRTRHSYATRDAGGAVIAVLYTAPIEQFDDKLLPSIIATLKMSGGKLTVYPKSSVNLSTYEPEILIDGERRLLNATGPFGLTSASYPVSPGKHRVTVRAKEHKPYEADIFVEGWEDKFLPVQLERTTSSTTGAKPE